MSLTIEKEPRTTVMKNLKDGDCFLLPNGDACRIVAPNNAPGLVSEKSVAFFNFTKNIIEVKSDTGIPIVPQHFTLHCRYGE